MSTANPSSELLWDVFCQVIDNHGDLGVCWRLAQQLAAHGQRVRLWVDDASALRWMAPKPQRPPHVQVLPWAHPLPAAALQALPPADVWIEAFGCELPPEFVARFAGQRRPPVWINLEYLSAEDWVQRVHTLPSPVLHGPAAGWTKWFFHPGFGPGTGGLLREADLARRQQQFDRRAWLAAQGVDWQGEALYSLFCYEPAALPALLAQLQAAATPQRLLITPGRAAHAVQQALGSVPQPGQLDQLQLHHLPYLPQTGFDELLWACDCNFVRGEDSLVRALWAGKPFVWHIYPQPEDNAHHAKLNAFLHWLQAPASWRQFHHVWNGLHPGPLPALAPATLAEWAHTAQQARQRLLAQSHLVTQLLGFVRSKG